MERPLFRDVISKDTCPPLVFRHVTKDWPALKWTPDILASVLEGKLLQCKIAPRDVEGVQWETESLHLRLTLQQYSDWLNGRGGPHNPLQAFHPDKFSCYVDYKYMKEMFSENPLVLKEVDWSVFGLVGRGGKDSTIWIGSAGAYTPCHYDTYGFNLVAQLHGRKRWYLFSPSYTQQLYATRIPFEESSVFSEVNIRWPDLTKHRQFANVEVYIVDLQPGEVLYVPRHWWHFVECLEPSISVNTWVPLKKDGVSQYHEAVSRLLFSTMFTKLPGDADAEEYLNTNEELQSLSVNLAYMNTALKHLQSKSIDTAKASGQSCLQHCDDQAILSQTGTSHLNSKSVDTATASAQSCTPHRDDQAILSQTGTSHLNSKSVDTATASAQSCTPHRDDQAILSQTGTSHLNSKSVDTATASAQSCTPHRDDQAILSQTGPSQLCSGDALRVDNFEKFSTAFPDVCVTCSSHQSDNNCNSNCKRKLEENSKAEGMPYKVQKSVERDRKESERCRNCQTYDSSEGFTQKRQDNKVEICQCNKYSFKQYIEFLEKEYDYDGYEPDVSELGSTSEQSGTQSVSASIGSDVTFKDVMNCVLQPEIVQHIAQLLQNSQR